MWRTLFVEIARLIQETYQKNLIIPMTVWRTPYFEEIRKCLREIDPEFYHFCLIAPASTIHERLLARGEEPNSWAERQAENCINAFKTDAFETRIDTTLKNSDEVLHAIVQSLPPM